MSLSERLTQIRTKQCLSQRQFAESIGVKEQAVQEWELGSALPDASVLIVLAEKYGLSLDHILLGKAVCGAENNAPADRLLPDFAALAEWESFPANTMLEYRQLSDEGLEVEPYRGLYEAVARLGEGEFKSRLADTLFEMSRTLALRTEYRYSEPSDYESIRALSKSAAASGLPDDGTLRSKVAGGWYGRICGCMLGKPVEGFLASEIETILRKTNNFPMRGYIMRSAVSKAELGALGEAIRPCLADEVDSAPADDDTNYTVMAQRLVTEHGRGFTPRNMADLWVSAQPKTAYCTAERIAFINFCNGYTPPRSAVYKNPFREWIGAQIRADYFGYINPCDPQAAAEMAWRDASISHTKNGIYGEMFVAGMIAAAFGTDDILAVIRAGLSVIPASSRLYERIEDVIRLHADGADCERLLAYIHEQYDESVQHDWCHTIPNAMLVVSLLLTRHDDYGRAICAAVETGFDTDCNAATVGSILGVLNGLDSIPEYWLAPVGGRLGVSICGEGAVSIDALVDKTLEHIAQKQH